MDNNELIEKFWIEQGGKPHMPEDLWFYENNLSMLMPVLDKIHHSKTYDDLFSKDPIVGVEIDIKISMGRNRCRIELPDTSEGYNYVEGCYYADPLFKCYVTSSTLQYVVYNAILNYINWYNKQKENHNNN